MTDAEQRQRRIRRSAMVLGLIALAFYLSIYVAQLARSAG